nr:hypothetical protein 8 [Balneolaceae bacterium]
MALTTEQQNQLDYLVDMVSLRVDEYLEKLDDGSRPEAPVGDIEKELSKAARYVVRRVRRPLALFAAKQETNISLIQNSQWDSTIIPLPADYMRFIRVQLDGWKRPVNQYLSDESRAYDQQVLAERRGTARKPKAFLIPYFDTGATDSNQALECFPKSDGLKQLVYIPYIESYDMPEELEDAMIWKAASVVLSIMRLSSQAQDAFTQMEIAVNNLNTGMLGEGVEG